MERHAILEKKGLTEHYRGNQALNNTYLGLSKGDHIAMVSDDGAGKSTFVRNLTDGEKPTSGTISLHGEEVKFSSPFHARETGIKIQDMSQPFLGMAGEQRQYNPVSRAAGWGSKLIIMREQTAALGVQETNKVEVIIRGLRQSITQVILISHNLRQVFELVDRSITVKQGRIVDDLDAKAVDDKDVLSFIPGLNEGVYENSSYI